MAIDITGLFVSDVQIKVQGHGILVLTQKQDCIEELLALPKPIVAYSINSALVGIFPFGTDVVALAERLAYHWESKKYTVERVFIPVGTLDSYKVQSFILV